MKYTAAIIYILVTTAFYSMQASGGNGLYTSAFDAFVSSLLMGLLPLVHFIIIKFIYEANSGFLPPKKRDYVYIMPILYPLFFNLMILALGDGNVNWVISNFSYYEVKYMTIIFILNFALIMICLIPPKSEPKTVSLAEPISSEDVEESYVDTKLYTPMMEVRFYVMMLFIFFSILIIFLAARLT